MAMRLVLTAAAAAAAFGITSFTLALPSSSPRSAIGEPDPATAEPAGKEGTCQVSCAAPNLIQENEPCGVNTVNLGCDGPPPHQFLVLRCPEGYCASSWAFNNMHDTDWYLTVVNDSNNDGTEYVCFQLISEFPAVLELYSGTCGSLTLIAQGETDNCIPTNVCACVPAPAQYLIKVYPGTIAGGPMTTGLPCALPTRDYTIEYMCAGVCPGSGACCYQIPGTPGFVCTITTQQDCVVNLHGIYQGNNTTCQPDPCNPATGACCYLDTSGVYACITTTQSDCENNLNGVYFGNNSSCPPPPLACDQFGACCYQIPGTPGFQCVITTQQDCIAVYNGTYLGNGTSCTPDPCNPTGACCYTDPAGVPACTVTTQQDCIQNLNGVYLGNNTTCTPDPCQSGACCYIGAAGPVCTITTQIDCTQNLNGTYLGNNTTCQPNPCVEGACCHFGPAGPLCTITTQQNCVQNLNGVFQGPNTTCQPNPCVEGACCFQEPGTNQFLCTIVTQAQCASLLNSTWLGAFTTCHPDPCNQCVKPPPDMVSWWTLDDPSSSTTAADAGGHPGTLMNGTLAGVPGAVNTAFGFDGVNDHIVVPHHSDHDFNCGPFSADAWVRLAPNQTGGIILEKWGSGFTGWSFLVDGSSSPPGALTLLLGTTTLRCIADSAPFSVTPGAWTHVAFTASTPFAGNRLITFYINGVPVSSSIIPCDCVPSVMPLFIGAGAFGQYWPGRLDEIELFDRELSAGEIQSIYDAGNRGKCKHHCHANWDVPYCINSSVLTTTVMVCNDSAVPQTYQLSFQGTSTVPNMICNGPVIPAANFTVIGGNTVNVPPATCVPVQVQIVRPAGLLPGQTSCYELTVLNAANGHVSICHGSVMRTNTWCWIVECCSTALPAGSVATAVFNVTNTADQDQTFTYTARVTGPDMMPDMQAVSLNGLPPGERVIDTISVPVGGSVKVPIDVRFLQHDAFAFYDLLISGDENNDGDDSEVVVSLALQSAPAVEAPVCYADINGDLQVSVLDLLAVINGWGPCPTPPPPGQCPADVAPPGGDGAVNVIDLLYIINAWGQCP